MEKEIQQQQMITPRVTCKQVNDEHNERLTHTKKCFILLYNKRKHTKSHTHALTEQQKIIQAHTRKSIIEKKKKKNLYR